MFKANEYDKIYPDRSKEVDFLLKYLKGKTVVDIGGGTGMISEALNKKGFYCTNLEPQKEMALISARKNINTIYSTIEDYEHKFGKYDNAIMMFNVFNFLVDQNKALNNISKLLKGKLIFTYYNNEIKLGGWKLNWKFKRLSRKVWYGNRVEIDFWFPFFHEHHTMIVYPHGVIRSMLVKNGFKVIEKIKDKYETTIVAEIC